MTAGRQPRSADDGDTIVAQIEKNSRESIRVTIGVFNGHPIAQVRTWYRSDGDELRPGKGLAFRIALLPAVADALAEAVRRARAEALLE